MNILIRCDASMAMGTGHLVRCMTLADALRDRGATVQFACHRLPEVCQQQLQAAGFAVTTLPGDAGDELADAAALIDSLGDVAPFDWLIVDHYGLGVAWEQAIQPHAKQIMAIDDLGRQHAVSLLLDQNLHAADFAGYQQSPPLKACTYLLGPHYALLRGAFADARKLRTRLSGPLKRVLVFYGGIDRDNETLNALKALAMPMFSGIEVDIVLGGSNPHIQDLQARFAGRAGWLFHIQTAHMATLMAEADLLIGGGGSVQWERLCVGLPAIVTSVADNQTAVCEALGDAGLAHYLGTADTVSTADLANALRHWQLLDATTWQQVSQKLLDTDTGGCHRVVDALYALTP